MVETKNLQKENNNIKYTIGLTILFFIIAILSSFFKNLIWTAISIGALGGILHEIMQSDGKIIKPYRDDCGVYLGAIYGLLVGAVAGVLVIQSAPETTVITNSLIIQIFLAGLAIKGVSESAAGIPKSTKNGKPPTPPIS